MIFTPPTTLEDPPTLPDTRGPAGLLFRFYKTRLSGVTVFKMSDGTYRIARPVAGLNVKVSEPFPATTVGAYPQLSAGQPAINVSWYDGVGTATVTSPYVTAVYSGGHQHVVGSAEAASLTAAGFGGYLR